MSLRDDGFENSLLTAKERDLEPLLDDCAVALDLDYGQTQEMEAFLNEAWFSGARNGHAQMRERAAQRRFDIDPVNIEEIEVEFKALMEASADALNLSMGRTIAMWGLLGRAWRAGVHTCEAELMAMFITARSDVAQEALEWLEDRDDNEEEGG